MNEKEKNLNTNKKTIYLIIPCFNEEKVLPITSKMFINKIQSLILDGTINSNSKILFVDDGSTDSTWEIISDIAQKNNIVSGIGLSNNMGHQNALLAGIHCAKDLCDASISLDCDGQDDINAVDEMICHYYNGSNIVYGVRCNRETDSFFKRTSAEIYYKLLHSLGGKIIYNHADYRLLDKKAMEALLEYKEANLFLRGTIPLLGFKSSIVYYKRNDRVSGETHYPLSKMLQLAFTGITNLSVKPLKIISAFGIIVTFISFVGIIWSVIMKLKQNTVSGWASIICAICFLSGVQLISLGIIGEYIGKIYLETKNRPKFFIDKRV